MLYVVELSKTKIKIVFSSTLANVSEAIEDSVAFLKKNKYTYDSFRLKLAIAEGLTNAVKHGNSHNPQLNVIYELDISSGKMIISFEDQGEGFDWGKKVHNGLPKDSSESGRGLFLMENYGFKMVYNSKGNKLVLKEP